MVGQMAGEYDAKWRTRAIVGMLLERRGVRADTIPEEELLETEMVIDAWIARASSTPEGASDADGKGKTVGAAGAVAPERPVVIVTSDKRARKPS